MSGRLRIITGSLKGRVLEAPEGEATRPPTGLIRGALFNILGESVVGARVLDLYAGSGSLGFEALSRGAASCVFVESNREALKCIEANIDKMDLEETARIVAGDVQRAQQSLVQRSAAAFDIVFADFPFVALLRPAGLELLTAVIAGNRPLLAPDGVQIVRVPRELIPREIPEGALEPRLYGASAVLFLKAGDSFPFIAAPPPRVRETPPRRGPEVRDEEE